MKKKIIKQREYWLTKDGQVVFVIGEIDDGKGNSWLVDKIDSTGNQIKEFPVAESNFDKKLSFQKVEEIVRSIFEKRVEDFLKPANEFSQSGIYLIQGLFFQEGTTMKTEKGVEGVRFFKGQKSTFFSGTIFSDKESRSGLMKGVIEEWTLGFMGNTVYRESIIWDVMISSKSIDFNKVYSGEERVIAYSFEKKEGNIWIGKYQVGESVGDAKCIITEISEDFFQPPPLPE